MDVLIPVQQLTKVIILMIGAILLALLDSFNLNQLKKSLDDLLDKIEIDKDLELAAVIQQNLIPGNIRLPGIKIHSYLESARSIGGDYFDIFKMKNGHIGFFIADVSGHGVSSALIATALKVVLQQAPNEMKKHPVELLHYLDIYFKENFIHHHMTAQYLYVNPEEKKIYLANAGHPFPIYIAPNQEPDFWISYGSLIGYGFFEIDTVLYSRSYEINDRIIFYTDGLLETMDFQGNLYGYQNFLDSIKESKKFSTEKLKHTIVNKSKSFHSLDTVEDDLALVILEFTHDSEFHKPSGDIS